MERATWVRPCSLLDHIPGEKGERIRAFAYEARHARRKRTLRFWCSARSAETSPRRLSARDIDTMRGHWDVPCITPACDVRASALQENPQRQPAHCGTFARKRLRGGRQACAKGVWAGSTGPAGSSAGSAGELISGFGGTRSSVGKGCSSAASDSASDPGPAPAASAVAGPSSRSTR